MNIVNKTNRILGAAFLFQFVTSFSSGAILHPAWSVPGDISGTMLKIADNATLMRANILVDMLTALGIIFLGVMLYLTLRKQNEAMAFTALGFYFLEAVLIAASRMGAFSLLRISQEYASTGQPAYLQTMGNLALESMDFAGLTLSMVAFCFGAIPFYYLLYKSKVVPPALSLWGLIAVFLCLIGTLFSLFGSPLPFIIYVPYVPFEFVVGVWILFKGTKDGPETASYQRMLHAGANA